MESREARALRTLPESRHRKLYLERLGITERKVPAHDIVPGGEKAPDCNKNSPVHTAFRRGCYAHRHAGSWAKHASKLVQAAPHVGKKYETKMANHGVKSRVAAGKGPGVHGNKTHRQTLNVGLAFLQHRKRNIRR
jgi:hypothetical protein